MRHVELNYLYPSGAYISGMKKLAATMKGIPAIRPVSMADVRKPAPFGAGAQQAQVSHGVPSNWRTSGPMVDERAPHQQLGDMFAKSLQGPGGNSLKHGAEQALRNYGL